MKTKNRILLIFTFIISISKAQVTITKPTLDLGACSFPTPYFTLGNIVITEIQNNDFSAGTNRTIIVNAPTGIEFQAGNGGISTVGGRNLSNELLTVASTNLTIQFSCNGTNKLDVLTISGLKIRALSIGNYSLVRNVGNAIVNGIPNGTALSGIIAFSSISANQFRTNPTIEGFLDWNSPSTWECNAVPPKDGSAIVSIRGYQNGSYNIGNSVYFSGNPVVKTLTIENNANLSGSNENGKTLKINENFTIQSGGVLQQINWSQTGINSIQIGGDFVNNGSMVSSGGSGGNGLRIVMNGLTPQIITGTGSFKMIGNGPGAGSLLISNPTGVELQANYQSDNSNGNSGIVIVDGMLTFMNSGIQFFGSGSLQLNGKTILKAGTFNEHYAMTGTRTIRNTSTIEYTNLNSSISATNIPSLNLNNLIINNSSFGNTTIQNPVTVGGTLTMMGGNISNGTNEIQLGVSITNKGNLSYSSGLILGRFKRWFSGINSENQTGLFPIGNPLNKQLRFVKIEYQQPTDGGTIAAEWINQSMGNSVTNQPVLTNCNNSFVISTTASGYWSLIPANGITNSENKTYQITLSATNLSDFDNACYLTAVKRDLNNIWSFSGAHIDNSGTASNPIISRLNATGWSNWGIGGAGNPLPIELLSMNLACEENNVVFSWFTASEHNSESFLLEKSENCFQWIKTSEIPAAGFSNEKINYVIYDKRISGLNYYRLSQKDFDGKERIYDPLFLDCQDESPFKILIWSNPDKTGFHLFVNDASLVGASKVTMKNNLGEVVLEQKINCESGSNIFDFSTMNFPKGIYFIQVSNERYFSEVVKHLVN
jgi:hypothetical protein